MATVQETVARVCTSSQERLSISSASRGLSLQLIRRSELAVAQSQRLLQPGAAKSTETSALEGPQPTLLPASSQLVDHFEVVRDREIDGEVVELDGKHFIDCRISNCTLIYSGLPLLLETTYFTGCRFRFENEAAMTLRLCECFQLVGSGENAYSIGSAGQSRTRPN